MKFFLKQVMIYSLLGLGLFFFVLMAKIVIPYFTFRYDIGFLLTKQTILYSKIWRTAFYTHITSSLVVLLFGLFQFIKPITVNFPKFHHSLGKTYIVLVLIISAPSGLIMAFYANGGEWAKISFVIISVLWWYFTFKAYQFALQKNFKEHLAFMFRSYALTLSAITFRLYVFLMPFVMHLHGKAMYVFVSWVSWIPNLLIAELLIREMRFYYDLTHKG